jgi:hypothetical protein
MFFKKEQQTKTVKKLPRIEKMDTPSIINWMDLTIMNLGQTFDNWRYKDLPEEEVSQHLEIVNGLWEELLSRKSNLNNK